MQHRGPDHRACSHVEGASLGHVRLSILDLSDAGNQPYWNEDKTIGLTFNGEIYNFAELRKELAGCGYRFRSSCDTEVLLRAYEAWGTDCLDRLRGMFAFAIWDARDKSLFLVRDRLGVKPVYYQRRGAGVVFASELKALLALGPRPSLQWDALMSYVVFLWNPDPSTPFEGIERLPPGHALKWRDGRLSISRYWDLDINPEAAGDEAEGDSLISRAVSDRMISDVPIASLLSGGLDSSLISALMAKQTAPGELKTYAIAFSEEDRSLEAMSDDASYARQVAAHIGSDHEEILIEPDIVNLLPGMLWHLDEPIADPAAINTFLIAQAARQRGTKVLLSGMGADEIFGGYRKHLSALLARRYRSLVPAFLREGPFRQLIQSLPVAGGDRGYKLFRWAKRFERSASLPDLDCFVGNFAYYTPEAVEEMLTADRRIPWEDIQGVRRHHEEAEKFSDRDLLPMMTALDTKLFLPGLNLMYSDKASMAASVELRVPFVDHEVVTFAHNLPDRDRIRGFRQKHMLKRIARRYLPNEIINRPKAPFGAPLRSWLRGDLNVMLKDLLSEESLKRRGYFEPVAIHRMIRENEEGREDHAHRLWGLLTFELWHRIFVDGDMNPSLPSCL
jgi:asparagine synthase (glutamine-hydrolysing)